VVCCLPLALGGDVDMGRVDVHLGCIDCNAVGVFVDLDSTTPSPWSRPTTASMCMQGLVLDGLLAREPCVVQVGSQGEMIVQRGDPGGQDFTVGGGCGHRQAAQQVQRVAEKGLSGLVFWSALVKVNRYGEDNDVESGTKSKRRCWLTLSRPFMVLVSVASCTSTRPRDRQQHDWSPPQRSERDGAHERIRE
jgi:hypothetical protein